MAYSSRKLCTNVSNDHTCRKGQYHTAACDSAHEKSMKHF